MNILFLEPAFPRNQREFVRALAGIGANVYGIGERPYDWLDDEVKGWLKGSQQIESVTNEPALARQVMEERNGLSTYERLALWLTDRFRIGNFKLVANEQDS